MTQKTMAALPTALLAAERTVAVGDGHDELSMFPWAARAVAVEDAPAGAQTAAGEIRGSITEHGVVDLLYSAAGVR